MSTPIHDRQHEIELELRELDLAERRWALRCRVAAFAVVLALTVAAVVAALVTGELARVPLVAGIGSAAVALDSAWARRIARPSQAPDEATRDRGEP